MACRIQNLTRYPLTLDLRGGARHLRPYETSPPLREEALYDNVHLQELKRSGAVRELPAKMADVVAWEAGAGSAPKPKETAARTSQEKKHKPMPNAKRPAAKPAGRKSF